MTTFVTPLPHGTVLQRITPSALVPSALAPPLASPPLRFAGDPLMWIGVPAGTSIGAIATGIAVCVTASSADGLIAGPCTIVQLSPLPQMNAQAFNAIAGGLPVQMVVVSGSLGAPTTDDLIAAGAPLVTAPPGAGSTAFLAVAYQDRLCRDPLTWAEAIAPSGACDAAWPQFLADLAALPNARNVRVLDHRGVAVKAGTVSISIDGGAAHNVTLTAAMDGDTGVAVAASSKASVRLSSAADPIVAVVDGGSGAPVDGVTGVGITLPPGKRVVQVLDAAAWLATPEPGVATRRWWANSNVEPIQEGTPYFARLVTDLRSAKPSNGHPPGAAQFSGWAFVKGSLKDDSVDWPLVPGDESTTFLNMVNELRGAGVNFRMLVNQFLQWDAQTLDDFPELVPILFAAYLALSPLQALLKLQTDPQGYVVGMIAVAALSTIAVSPFGQDLITKHVELSKPMMDALAAIDPTIATWTPYPAAFADNPLVSVPPTILGHTLDDLSHMGVYHQKTAMIRPSEGDLVAYLGGIEINSDRPDTSIHRAEHPFHDVQARLTGPAVYEVLRTYQERAILHNAPTIAIPLPATNDIPATGTHLVQIGRTYFKPKVASPTQALPFAPNGESTPTRSLIAAINAAQDFIYIEDQYFTPSDHYLQALIDAASRDVRALMITMPVSTDQPYGSIRRADVLNALSTAWGSRLNTGMPVRRYLHEVPGLTTNLGRMSLGKDLGAGINVATLQPVVRLPSPPFWAFIENELVMVYALQGPPGGTTQDVQILRPGGAPSWGAQPVAHKAGAPVLAVQVPGIYVHAKVMIVDDVFVQIGSSNVNRRSHYHDGEINSFAIPQRLRADPTNPARILRCRLMAEHLGLSPEMGLALFADPVTTPPLFAKTWYEGTHRQSLSFFGSAPDDVPVGISSSIPGFVLQAALGLVKMTALKDDMWPLMSDPTTSLDPTASSRGPEYP